MSPICSSRYDSRMNLKAVFDSIAAKLVIDFDELSAQIQHKPSKGHVREIEIVEQFLRLYLPRSLGIGHGEIVATDGSVSNEADIVFYEANGCPTLIEKTGYQVFPVECVHGVMEVKSHLDGAEMNDAFKKINRLKQFPKNAYEPQTGPVLKYSHVYGKEWEFFPTVGIVFAYDSMDLNTLRNRIDELQASVPVHQRVDFIAVLKKGLLVNWDDKKELLNHTPTEHTRLRAVESSNPLLLMVIFLQQIFQSTWMRRFVIRDYFTAAEYGRFLDI